MTSATCRSVLLKLGHHGAPQQAKEMTSAPLFGHLQHDSVPAVLLGNMTTETYTRHVYSILELEYGQNMTF